jgi:hypothetical protein
MGRPEEQRGKQTLAVAVDIEGNANYDAIVRQGARANKVVHTGHQALIPKVDLMDPSVSHWVTHQQLFVYTAAAAYSMCRAAG